MRVISGRLKGRKLTSIKGYGIRPTSDKLKESIFDILGNDFDGRVVLDLFAGTGSLGIEALSRGALTVVFVDTHPYSIAVIKKNLVELGLLNCAKIFKRNPLRGLKFLKKISPNFDFIFLDPPYGKRFVDSTLKNIAQSGIIMPTTLVVAEHSVREVVTPRVGNLLLRDQRKYGKTLISFFQGER